MVFTRGMWMGAGFYRSYLIYTFQITNGKIAIWAYHKKIEIKVEKMTGTT